MASVTLTPDVTLNGETVDITVYEDLGDTGSSDNNETVTDVSDGTTYDLDSLGGGEGNAYWVEIDLSTEDITESPVVNGVTLEVQTALTGTSEAELSASGAITGGRSSLSGTSEAELSAGGAVTSTGTPLVGTSEASLSASGEVRGKVLATTTLPDEDQPVLGNGVEDEVAVDRESETTNNGDIRLQIREEEAESWDSDALGFEETTVAYDTLTYDFTGREDGEEYEVRARSETDHRTGAWTDPVSIVTKFPGVTDLEVTDQTETSVSLEWTDNADNEDGQEVIREERVNGEWAEQRVVEDVGPNTESYTDETALPDKEYRYRIRAYTDDTSGESDTVTAFTDSDDAPKGTVPSDNWRVEVTHDSGTVVRPTLIDDPRWVPKLNERPEAVIPVANAERYDHESFDGAEVSVWKEGLQLPLDRLTDVKTEAGERGSLILRGASQLTRRASEEYENTRIDEAAEALIEDITDYTANVDTPVGGTTSNIEQQDIDDTADWNGALDDEPGETDPWEVSDGALETLRVGWVVPATDDNTIRGEENFNTTDNVYYDDRIFEFDDTEKNNLESGFEDTVPVGYRIPEENVNLGFRIETIVEDPDEAGSAAHNGFEIRVNGNTIEDVPPDVLSYDDGEPDWFSADGSNVDGSGDLEPGDVEIEMRFDEETETSVDEPDVGIDAAFLWDDRYTDQPAAALASDGRISADEYPSDIEVETDDVDTLEQVSGGRVETEVSDTGGYALALSNDGGSSFPISNSGESDLEGDFDETENRIRVRFTLAGYDDGSEPATGRVAPTSVDAYQLFTDLDSTPFITNRSVNGDLEDVLTEIADLGGYIWEVRRDDGYSVEFTEPGARVNDDVQGVSTDFSITRKGGDIIRAAEITGGRAPRNGERFEASEYDEDVDLSRSRIIDGTEQVYDPDDSTVFEYGDDYRTGNRDGTVRLVDGGDMDLDTEYAIDYEYKPVGTYEAGSYDGDTEELLVDTIPGLTSETSAGQAALRIVARNSDPLIEAELTLSEVGPDLSLVESLGPAIDAFDDRSFEVWESESKPQQARLKLGSGEEVDETVRDIESTISTLSDRS